MKSPIMYRVMLNQVWAACKRAAGFVNVFKKKSCGASPVNGESLEQRKKNAEFTNTIYRLLAKPDCI